MALDLSVFPLFISLKGKVFIVELIFIEESRENPFIMRVCIAAIVALRSWLRWKGSSLDLG